MHGTGDKGEERVGAEMEEGEGEGPLEEKWAESLMRTPSPVRKR